MATVNISGTGAIASTDYHAVKWVGKTKGGQAVTISLNNAINMGNIDWSFADKDDLVSEIVFTATYDNTDAAASSTTEPWSIEIDSAPSSGSGEIIIGAGIFYVDNVVVGMTRGGGSFTVEREFREIAADGDRGPVKGRIVIDGSRATLTMNVVTIINSVKNLYAGLQ